MLLRFGGMVNLIFILYVPLTIKGENSADVMAEGGMGEEGGGGGGGGGRENEDLCSDIYQLISFKPGAIVETTKLFIKIPVWMTLTFIQGHSCMRN